MKIREATEADFEKIWPIFHEIISVGETYAYPQDTSIEEAYRLWMLFPRKTYAAVEEGQVLGSYYIKTNQAGPGSHVCNCGYIVSINERGRGLATSMCEHSQKTAIELGYKAMQFNFVVATNVGAIRIWNRLGFDTVGRLPKAFNHPARGYVDVLVMYKWLES